MGEICIMIQDFFVIFCCEVTGPFTALLSFLSSNCDLFKFEYGIFPRKTVQLKYKNFKINSRTLQNAKIVILDKSVILNIMNGLVY